MKGQHFAAIAGVLAGLATQIAGLHSWHDATTPSFVSGIILLLSGAAGLLFSDNPSTDKAPRP